MSLEEFQPVYNTGIRLKEPLGAPEGEIRAFFEEVRQAVPALNHYEHEGADFNLVERGAGRPVRQVLVGEKAITLAVGPPVSVNDANEFATNVYPLISSFLKPSPLLLEHMDVSFRFGFPFKGNHDQLVLASLFGGTPYAEIATNIEGAVRDFRPTVSFSLTSDHSVLALIEIHTGTSSRETESGVYDGDDIRVVCGIAKVRGLTDRSLEETYASLHADGLHFVEEKLVPLLLQPIQKATSETQTR